MSNLERIKTAIQKSKLKTDERIKLIDMFVPFEDIRLIDVANLFEKQPEWVEKTYQNLKEKQQAFETEDQKLWQEIFEREEKELKNLQFGLD